jgi:hypothetical protein
MQIFIEGFKDFYHHNIKRQKEISKTDCQAFLHCVVELHRQYSMMNYEHTDNAFLLKDTNETIAKNLEIIANYKNEMRDFLNEVCFESGGYMDTFCSLLSQQFNLIYRDFIGYTQTEVLELYTGKRVES